ncbi:MAG: single-stranded-DNA-specific exonuclease RecJ [Lachnospiraceae bacterium]
MEDKSVWMTHRCKGDFTSLAEKLNLDPVVARVMINNLGTAEPGAVRLYLEGGKEDLQAPDAIREMPEAAALLKSKCAQRKKIRIIGDYDADGICATSVLLKALKSIGADVSFAIPNRITDGYGVNVRMIREAAADGVDTILTCDNGISAAEAVKEAKEHGITVIVTDHHELPFDADGAKRPDADVVVDCRRADETAEFRDYCGAALAFQLARLLTDDEELLSELACLASIATVTDVMPLTKDNRILVKYGLAHLPGIKNTGLQALYESTGIADRPFSVYILGFVIGPCLNASGRLASADIAVRLLTTKDTAEAKNLAETLHNLNEQRKEMTEQQTEKAMQLVQTRDILKNPVLVLHLPDCPEAVAGIVAGRVKEKFYRPTLVAVDTENGSKGSGRSIDGYDMFREMSRVKELFTAFGGHPKAAGFSLPTENIEELDRRLNGLQTLSENELTEKTYVEPLYMDYSGMERVARQMTMLEPFGEGNSAPAFADRGLFVVDTRIYGRNRNVCDVTLRTPRGNVVKTKMFGAPDFNGGQDLPARGSRVAVCYEPTINEYQGRESLQLLIRKFKYQK